MSQAQMKEKVAKKEKEKKKVEGGSTKKIKEDRSIREVKDSEEMVQRRSMNQDEVDNLWKDCAVEWMRKSWRRARSKGPRRVSTSDVVSRWNGESSTGKKYQPRKWDEDCWARTYSWFSEAKACR